MNSISIAKTTYDILIKHHPEISESSLDATEDMIGIIAKSVDGNIEILEKDDMIQISYEEVSREKAKESAEKAKRAAKKSAKGDYEGALPFFEKALRLNPFSLEARRDYAMSLMELKEFEKAISELTLALCFAPDDAWTYVVLANYYLKYRNEYMKAENLLNHALEYKPDDPWALNSMGALYSETKRFEEGKEFFNRAIESNPKNPNPYFGLALGLIHNEGPLEAHKVLLKLFKEGKKQDSRSEEVYENARSMFMKLQPILAEGFKDYNQKALDRYKKQLEARSGFPIETEHEKLDGGIQATLKTAWKHSREKHLLQVNTNSDSKTFIYYQIHELKHLELECAAREIARNKFFTTTNETRENAIRSMSYEISSIQKKGYDEEQITSLILDLVHGFSRFLFNCPVDMVIEKQIARDFPELWHEQFLGLRQQVMNAIEMHKNKKIQRVTPNRLLKLTLTLNGSYAIFVDELFEGVTGYQQEFKSMGGLKKSKQLHEKWLSSYDSLEPGDEYDLVDEFAKILNVTEWYAWQNDPENAEKNEKEGVTNPELLGEKTPATVFYFLGALKMFGNMDGEGVRKISFEIAMLGQNGLDYSSPEQKYTVKSLPGQKYSGLHLMCIMFAGFQRIAPEMDVGMDLHEPYAQALQLYNQKE